MFGLYVACFNWAAIFISIRNERRGIAKRYSLAPAIGPVLGYVGLKALPIHLSPWVWLVLLLDPSTFVVVVSLPFLFRQGVSQSERERMRERRSRLREAIRSLARKWRH